MTGLARTCATSLDKPGSTLRPIQAAWISAVSFAAFAGVPVAALLLAPAALRIPMIAALSLVSLAA